MKMKKNYLTPETAVVMMQDPNGVICSSPVVAAVLDWEEDNSWGSLF